jgi:hypothetical protein
LPQRLDRFLDLSRLGQHVFWNIRHHDRYRVSNYGANLIDVLGSSRANSKNSIRERRDRAQNRVVINLIIYHKFDLFYDQRER